MDVKHRRQQVLDDILLARLPGFLDLLDLLVGVTVGVVLGLLVSLCVLSSVSALCRLPQTVHSPPTTGFGVGEEGWQYLGLMRPVLSLLGRAVGFDLLLGFVAGFADALGAVWWGSVNGGRVDGDPRGRTLAGWIQSGKHIFLVGEGLGGGRTLLDNLGRLPLGLVMLSATCFQCLQRGCRHRGSYVEQGLDARGVLRRLSWQLLA